MMWLALVGSVYAVFVQGTYAGYHYLPGLALGATLVGHMFSMVVQCVVNAVIASPASRRSTHLAAAVGFLSLASLSYLRHAPFRDLVTLQFLEPPRPDEYRNETVFDFTESFDVAAYLQERTRPDETIQVWGFEAIVYYLADRSAASRFQTTDPLVMRVPGEDLTPMQQRWRAEFVSDIEQRKPGVRLRCPTGQLVVGAGATYIGRTPRRLSGVERPHRARLRARGHDRAVPHLSTIGGNALNAPGR